MLETKIKKINTFGLACNCSSNGMIFSIVTKRRLRDFDKIYMKKIVKNTRSNTREKNNYLFAVCDQLEAGVRG